MPRKRVNAPRRTAASPAEVGVVARLVDRAFDDPAMSGGLFVLTLTMMAIVSNALFLQPASHPKPLFRTRSVEAVTVPAPAAVSQPSDGVEVPLPRGRDEAAKVAFGEQTGTVAPPAPAVIPASEVTMAPPPAATPVEPVQVAAPDPQAALIVDIQRELARLGLYSGAIDGIAGSQTREAIARYQSAAGLARTGEPDAALLDLLTAPAPPADLGPAAQVTPRAPPPLDIEAIESRNDELARQERMARVQQALNKIGYGPLHVDGAGGPETANAIRRFELDNGLTISGAPSDALFARLVAIGALDPA